MQIPLRYRSGQRKPYGSIPRIDRSHPLAFGLQFYGYDVGGTIIDLVGGKQSAAITTRPGRGNTKVGSGINYGFGVAMPAIIGQVGTLTAPYTFAAAIFPTTIPLSAALFGNGDSTGANNAFSFVQNASDTSFIYGWNNGANNDTLTVASATNGYHSMCAVAPTSTTTKDYWDGALNTSNGATTTNTALAGEQYVFGSFAFGSQVNNNFVGFIYYGAYWTRALSASEALQLHLDPYCFLIYPEDEMFATLVGISAAPAQIVEQNFFDVVRPRRAVSYDFVQGPFSGTSPALSGTFATSPFFESVKLKQPVINISDITPAEPIKLAGEKWFDPLQIKRPSIDNAPILFQPAAITANIVEQPFFEPISLKRPSEFTQGPFGGSSPALSGTFATSAFFDQIRPKQPVIDKPSDLPPLAVVVTLSATNWFDALRLKRPTVEAPPILQAIATGTVVEQAFFDALRLKQPVVDNAPILFQPPPAVTTFIVEQPFFDRTILKRPSEFFQGPFAGTSPALTNAYITQAFFDQIKLKQPVIDKPTDMASLVVAINLSATNWFDAVRLLKLPERFGELYPQRFWTPESYEAWFDQVKLLKVPERLQEAFGVRFIPSILETAAFFDSVKIKQPLASFEFLQATAQAITIQNALVDWFAPIRLKQPIIDQPVFVFIPSTKTFSLIGQTIDSAGNPIPGATVLLFRTSDNKFIASTVSDAGANFAFTGLPDNTTVYFVNGYLVGAPDIFGTTSDKLTPS